jgi:hypothetical protein
VAIRGSCLCGAVSYEITGSLGRTGHCHCSMCRKSHGQRLRRGRWSTRASSNRHQGSNLSAGMSPPLDEKGAFAKSAAPRLLRRIPERSRRWAQSTAIRVCAQANTFSPRQKHRGMK